MNPRVLSAVFGVCVLIAGLGALSLFDSCKSKVVHEAEQAAAVAQGEANAHQQAAQAIPSHEAVLGNAQAVVDQARAEVARLRKQLEAASRVQPPSEASAGSSDPAPVAPDLGELVRSQGTLIEAQDGQIKALKLALQDETSRSGEWKAAFEAERRRSAGLEIALAAQKSISKSDCWLGRVEGLALGIGVGYVGSKL